MTRSRTSSFNFGIPGKLSDEIVAWVVVKLIKYMGYNAWRKTSSSGTVLTVAYEKGRKLK